MCLKKHHQGNGGEAKDDGLVTTELSHKIQTCLTGKEREKFKKGLKSRRCLGIRIVKVGSAETVAGRVHRKWETDTLQKGMQNFWSHRRASRWKSRWVPEK